MAKIAFIGLGNMGLPMATNLVAAGHTVVGVDLAPANLSAASAKGISPAASLPLAVAQADMVMTMLPAGPQVQSVYTDADGVLAHAKSGALMIDCSTIDVATARAVAAAASDRGFGMVDAPVSGGVGGAEAGTLTFMVGGEQAHFARAHQVLTGMGKRIVHTGAAGAGQAAKICNNMMLGIQMLSVAEAFALADALELDRQKLFDVSSTASGQCWSLTTYCPVPGPVPTSPANREYAPGFAAAMMLKDLKLSQAAAASVGVDTAAGELAMRAFDHMCANGMAELDFSAIFEAIRRKA